ncbi:MAG: DUF6089 family protein [Paludibacter sp.]
MKSKIISAFHVFLMLIFAANTIAQTDYNAEIGVSVGGSYYLGDATNKPFTNIQPDFGLIYRHKLTPRYALSVQWDNTKVKGGNGTTAFENVVNEFNVMGEYNFFDHEDKVYKPNSRKHTFYIAAGVGGMLIPYTNSEGTNTEFHFSYPMGIGYKIMWGQRLNINFIWTHTLLLTDKMEGISALNNNSGLNGSNLFNNDWISNFKIAITLNIWKKQCDCLQYNR